MEIAWEQNYPQAKSSFGQINYSTLPYKILRSRGVKHDEGPSDDDGEDSDNCIMSSADEDLGESEEEE